MVQHSLDESSGAEWIVILTDNVTSTVSDDKNLPPSQIPVYVGAAEGLVHVFHHPPDRHFHGYDGFCDVQFPDDPLTDEPDNPIIRPEHAAVTMRDLVQKYPGNL